MAGAPGNSKGSNNNNNNNDDDKDSVPSPDIEAASSIGRRRSVTRVPTLTQARPERNPLPIHPRNQLGDTVGAPPSAGCKVDGSDNSRLPHSLAVRRAQRTAHRT